MIGKILGDRYELREKIGTGGMADVYKAYCKKLNRFVAVKVLKNEFRDDEEFINRFNLESQAAAGISHSNIVSVYDVGCEDDVHYIVMEYVDGITLKSYIATHGMLPWRQALDFSIQICDAMEHAHREGIVHRDIKPQNIMVTGDNTLKVMDFGIARTANKDITTDSNTAIGTVHYISPEQARGGYVDERSDIYSMGVVMYEMLTGRVPFDGETAVSIAIMHMQNKPVPPRDIVLSIPFELEAICLKAMAKEQTERYKNAGDLIADLKIVERDTQQPSNTSDYKTVEDYEEIVPVNRKTSEEPEKRIIYKQNKKKKQKSPEEIKSDKKAKIILGCASLGILLIFIIVFTVAIKPDIFRDTWFGDVIGVKSTAIVIDKIPDFEGRKVDDVVAEYEDNANIRIVVDSERVESVEYDEGYIVSQSPKAGEKVTTRRVTITVVVSKGLEDGLSEVPGFEGKHYQDAVKTLDKYDIKYKIVPDSSEDVAEGYVISQTPAKGKKLTSNTVVKLYVNMEEEEEELTMVPKIEGYDSYDAKTEVEKAGLIWGTVTEEASDKPKGVVISQSPAGGSEVKKGYRVSVIISSGESKKEEDKKEEQPEVDNPQMSTRYISITLPQDRAAVNVTVKIDGNTIHEQAYDTAAGTADIRLTSHGTKNVEIYFDGELSESTTINFDE